MRNATFRISLRPRSRSIFCLGYAAAENRTMAYAAQGDHPIPLYMLASIFYEMAASGRKATSSQIGQNLPVTFSESSDIDSIWPRRDWMTVDRLMNSGVDLYRGRVHLAGLRLALDEGFKIGTFQIGPYKLRIFKIGFQKLGTFQIGFP